MSIQLFGEFLDSHADVAQKVASCSTFDEVSAIAKANGFEVTGAELTQHAAKATFELSDESLEAVAGGAWTESPGGSSPQPYNSNYGGCPMAGINTTLIIK